MPLRWRILLPFATLALLYGVMGTYVFTRSTAAEIRSAASGRLRDAAELVNHELQSRQLALTRNAFQISRTDGVPDAVEDRDGRRLRALVVPLAVNAKGDLVVVVDRRGASILEVRDPTGRVRPGDELAGALVDVRARPIGELRSAAIKKDGFTYLAVAAPIPAVRGSAPAGVAVVADRLDTLVGSLERVTDARISVLDGSGLLLTGTGVPPPPSSGISVQTRGTAGGDERAFLYTPFSFGGERSGTLVVSTPEPSGLGALGSAGWKIAFIAIGALAGVFLAGLIVARRIAGPLGTLVASTRALSEGQLAHRAPIDRGDEVGELARAFNKMAADLETSHGDLERRVEERTRELAQAMERLDRTNAELAQASEAKSGFLASMSHELRTPLTAILMSAEMIRDARASLTDRQLIDLAGRIVGSGRHLLGLIEELLDLSKIEAGKLELHTEPVALRRLLAEVDASMRPIAAEKGVSLRFPSLDGEHVRADPLRLRQVLLNLLTNAIKFTPSGGKVSVRVASAKRNVEISVRDTGEGIEGRDLERIFEPFERATGANVAGAGLGLAISRRIAEMHGGRLNVSSVVGKGSVFSLTLPRAERQRSTARPVPLEGSVDAVTGARVLIVEDDPSIRELVSQVLSGAGYRVDRATSPEEALGAIRRRRPQLVLLDLHLGDGDGLVVVRELRRARATAGLPVVVLSASAGPADIRRAMEAGCNGYLSKPIGKATLLARVREHVDASLEKGRR